MEVNDLFQGILVLFIEEAHSHLAATTKNSPTHASPTGATSNAVNQSPKQLYPHRDSNRPFILVQ